eukprot:523525_1
MSSCEKESKSNVPNTIFEIQPTKCPYYLSRVHFVYYSHDTATHKSRTRRMMFLGGTYDNETEFVELIPVKNKTNNKLTYKFKKLNDGKTKNADLKQIGLTDARRMIAFITKNNDFIIVFKGCDNIYNVYDIISDKWLINKNKKYPDIFGRFWMGERGLFIDDKIIILSYDEEIRIYNLSDLYNPHQIEPCYEIKTPLTPNNSMAIGHHLHGLSLISCSKDKNIYKISFLMFGGIYVTDVPSTFILFNLELKLDNDNNEFNVINMSEKGYSHINNLDTVTTLDWGLAIFGWECVKNVYGQHIIIIIHGETYLLYNVELNRITEYKNVLPIDCNGDDPATVLNRDICHVIYKHDYFTINLSKMIAEYDGYGIGIGWSIERLLWIAYHKNQSNYSCLLAQIPKDIIMKILSY